MVRCAHSTKELGMALGHVIYDMLMLLVSLSVHRKRRGSPTFKGLTWGEPQIAIEVILLKSRALMDFLSPPPRASDRDIQIKHYGLPPIQLPPPMRQFRESVNKWSAHLSWQRVRQSAAEAARPSQADMEEHALWLLRVAYEFVNKALASGIPLTEERHQRFLSVFRYEIQNLSKP